jgi:hypothetical protein
MHLSAGSQLFDGKWNDANTQPDDKRFIAPSNKKAGVNLNIPASF